MCHKRECNLFIQMLIFDAQCDIESDSKDGEGDPSHK